MGINVATNADQRPANEYMASYPEPLPDPVSNLALDLGMAIQKVEGLRADVKEKFGSIHAMVKEEESRVDTQIQYTLKQLDEVVGSLNQHRAQWQAAFAESLKR